MYFIGIDGGGTYSRLIAANESGDVIGRHTGSSTNLCSNHYDAVKNNINELIKGFNEQTNTSLQHCTGFCIGSAGIDNFQYELMMEKLLREIGVACPIKVVNDSSLILAAETKGKAGICVISGTGSVAFAIDEKGLTYRAGGWGYLIDDIGSGYYIGIQAINYALMAYDGRGESTVLVNILKEHYKLEDLSNILNIIYTEDFNKSKVAEIALLVKQAALEKDAVALQIEEKAAVGLFEHAKALIERTNLRKHKIILSGSVILLNKKIRDRFTQLVAENYSDMEIRPIKEKAEMGAVYLAMNSNPNCP